jgi:hypothetical protein
MTRKPASPALLALTASALAALAPRAHGQEPPAAASQVDYRFSLYREDALPADKVTAGNGERYEIQTHQFRLTQGLGDGLQLAADLAYETMSGASPWYVTPGAGGRPVQVMSRASIEDARTDLLLGLTRRKDRTGVSLSAGVSTENDYQAINGALGVEHELADRVTTLSAGVGYSADALEPTAGTTATGTADARRDSATAYLGYARILGAQTVVQTSLNLTQHDGYLADPYKAAYVQDSDGAGTPAIVFDRRPGQRSQLAWLTRLRHFFKAPGAALHADYRYYHDDWEVDAHTVDLAWHQRVGASVRLVPGVRWYSQSQAYFYEPYYARPRADALASSDYRLSPYGALGASLLASAELGGWTLNLRYERYDSGPRYALGDVRLENPGLVDFQTVSLGVKKVF